MQEIQLPQTLLKAVTYFSIPENCSEFVKRIHWSDGNAVCPECESKDVILMAKRQKYHCRECRKQFSIKYGTIFEHSPLPLSKWLPVMWLMANAKNGISSHEIARSIGVTQKTAWFMSHRIREAMRTGTFKKLSGTVEADETYIGGLEKNRHASQRGFQAQGGSGKTIVFAAVERGGDVHAQVIDNTGAKTIQSNILAHVKIGSNLHTDENPSYPATRVLYKHASVNHSKGEYVRGKVHTNTVEGFFALFKRCIKGTHIHLSSWHLDRYLDEECYRYNMRKTDDGNRFAVGMTKVVGRRLTWNQLTGKPLWA
jgi:transposase-like protein